MLMNSVATRQISSELGSALAASSFLRAKVLRKIEFPNCLSLFGRGISLKHERGFPQEQRKPLYFNKISIISFPVFFIIFIKNLRIREVLARRPKGKSKLN